MKLTAVPFDPATGELLPVYRDAYLRGDLAGSSARAVEDYLQRDTAQAHGTVSRWHELRTEEAAAPAAPGWVQQQLRFIRQQPRRIKQRAAVLGAVVALVAAGASMASTMRPGRTLPVASLPVATLPTPVAEPMLTRTMVVHGRVLDEKGQPLAGATVLRKGTALGVSTDAEGNYSLRVPADGSATLQYGFGGYAEQELPAAQAGPAVAVTLQPRAAARHRRWLLF